MDMIYKNGNKYKRINDYAKVVWQIDFQKRAGSRSCTIQFPVPGPESKLHDHYIRFCIWSGKGLILLL